MWNRILGLTNSQSIKEKVGNVDKIYFKSGVWNEYELKDTKDVLSSVDNSSYGGDLYQDENGNYYVCCPSYCDMF